jgi:hypothetical protein
MSKDDKKAAETEEKAEGEKAAPEKKGGKKAKKNQVLHAIKEDGKRYNVGEEYTGKNAKKWREKGNIE